ATETRGSDEKRLRGDSGAAAKTLLEWKYKVGLRKERIAVEEVYGLLERIAKSSGPGSVESKIRQLTSLVSKALPMEAKYIIRIALGKLRLGVTDMTLLDPIPHASGDGQYSKPQLQIAHNLRTVLG